MVKTKIAFADIAAGDLIESVSVIHGVKLTNTGIAFEKNTTKQGDSEWLTSQGGTITIEDDGDTIHRIDVRECSFEDIQSGDLIRTTVTIDDAEFVMTGRAHTFQKADADWYDGWATLAGHTIAHRNYRDTKIEILERGTGA